MNPIAERYVQLVLAVGQHDGDYVDAYYGPPAWQEAMQAAGQRPLEELRGEATALLAELDSLEPGGDDMALLRHQYLTKQLRSVVARLDLLSGERLTFDQESEALYDAVAPTNSDAYFQDIANRLAGQLPGQGPLHERHATFRAGFIIPPERLDSVFSAAIEACRTRTLEYLELPADESFTVEYVTDKSWSAYNWYQGKHQSLIQVNTDFPIYIDRAIDLACHEGYPGHHTYNVLLESQLVEERGWVEFSVYPLFSPQSLIAEGSANLGIDIAFPGDERLTFERDVLFPLAGLDPLTAARYYEVEELVGQLSYAGNEAARRYLNGEIDATQAAAWLAQYALMPLPRAEQRVRFIDQYRSYVINYNLGKDLVGTYVERTTGPDASAEQRWQVFGDLLSSPRLPSGLR